MRDFEERMRLGWHGGLADGTVCGKGSTMRNTANVRAALPELITRYGINEICDAGAGDQNWIKKVVLSYDEHFVQYDAFDLVPRNKSVKKLDIRTQTLPRCDLIICRMVLNHLAPIEVMDALALFHLKGKYLLATQHNRWNANGRQSADYTEWNLEQPPFNLGPPIESIQEDVHPNCFLSLWDLHRGQ